LKTEENMFPSANVLVVDDDPAILRLLTHLLEQTGHRVRTAIDGNQCLQMILQDCPDVLISDWMMPGLDGLELCRRVRQLHQRKVLPHYTYILLLTAKSGKKAFIEGLEAGADDFIEKSSESLSDLRIEIKARFKAAIRTRKLESELEFAAKYDALTQLLNRLTFFDLAQVIWDRSIKNKFPLSAVMFDCDFFKRVNDIHGHLAGDAVLREMASILKEFSRSSDLICRYGGEEFCVLLPGCNEKTAWNWAERIRKRFEKNPVKSGNFEISITVSFGIAERLDYTMFFDQLVEQSDQALLFAKESGRNRCIRFSETIANKNDYTHTAHGMNELFTGVTAGDVMTPFTLSFNINETVASAIDFFLKTRIESLPVVDENDQLIGMVTENNLIPLLGDLTRWQEPIKDLVTPNVISYPQETPLRVVFDFLCRVSVKQILIVQENIPIGFINRTPLLQWLRNRWATSCENFDRVIPAAVTSHIPIQNLIVTIEELTKDLKSLEESVSKKETKTNEEWTKEYLHIITLISQSQDLMDQILKYSSLYSNPLNDSLSQLRES
jgi:two-component system chemotaxis response regulator CheY